MNYTLAGRRIQRIVQQLQMSGSQSSSSSDISTRIISLPTYSFPGNLLSSLPLHLIWKSASADETSESEYILRRLQNGDNRLRHLELLAQLTTVGKITDESYEATLQKIFARPDEYVMLVVEKRNIRTGVSRLVACGTAVIEYKFIHGAGKVAHIEDVVVDKTERGKQLGTAIVSALRDVSIFLGCYKVILDCDAHNMSFYVKVGFIEKARQMAFYAK